jgi:hypothetical protein
LAAAEPFDNTMQQLAQAPGAGPQRWGEWFTFEHSDSHGHVLDWGWAKALRSIGVTEEHKQLLTTKIVQGKYYHARPDLGFRIEGAGLGFLFTRILAAYLGLAPKPLLQDDAPYDVLPLDGPPAKGNYIGNLRSREVHDNSRRTAQCQIDEIRRSIWFRDLAEARRAGFDNCAYCLGGSRR